MPNRRANDQPEGRQGVWRGGMDSRERRGQPAWFMSLTGCSGQDRRAGERRGNGPSEDRPALSGRRTGARARALEGLHPGPSPCSRGSLSLLRTFSRPGGSRESCWLQGQHLGGEVDSRGEWAPDRVLFLKGQAGCVSAHGAGSTGASRASLL